MNTPNVESQRIDDAILVAILAGRPRSEILLDDEIFGQLKAETRPKRYQRISQKAKKIQADTTQKQVDEIERRKTEALSKIPLPEEIVAAMVESLNLKGMKDGKPLDKPTGYNTYIIRGELKTALVYPSEAYRKDAAKIAIEFWQNYEGNNKSAEKDNVQWQVTINGNITPPKSMNEPD